MQSCWTPVQFGWDGIFSRMWRPCLVLPPDRVVWCGTVFSSHLMEFHRPISPFPPSPPASISPTTFPSLFSLHYLPDTERSKGRAVWHLIQVVGSSRNHHSLQQTLHNMPYLGERPGLVFNSKHETIWIGVKSIFHRLSSSPGRLFILLHGRIPVSFYGRVELNLHFGNHKSLPLQATSSPIRRISW